jgi:hypothetical protein
MPDENLPRTDHPHRQVAVLRKVPYPYFRNQFHQEPHDEQDIREA